MTKRKKHILITCVLLVSILSSVYLNNELHGMEMSVSSASEFQFLPDVKFMKNILRMLIAPLQ